ncbi:PREDICTED: disease resistance protein RML1B-like isoform X2 [Camelina sativa]|uniref:Disease resistance protein RML1B-like isoform X2 n=1 Tax=Camelina sativa TaxID=90675 RepID=A0ABM0SZ36_CAMSA|nr:PREDICTED: disease resistance protein RML1B-like isoform X2 [Camelina sativa]
MASPSCFTSRNYKFNVFSSFHGPDVRKTLLSHLREQFKRNGITMFNDQEIKRSAMISPSLKEAIKESRISIVILSKKYASSSWCLDELVEILECKKARGQMVMTIFYQVEPSDVRYQTGDFGIAFNKTCARKTNYKEKKKWSRALKYVGNIAGEDFKNWINEAKMIEKIAKDVLDKLNATPSRDFDGMVGLETHLREIESLLDLDNDRVKVVGIFGPAGIGKSTIARALHSRLSNRFQLTFFVDNLRETYPTGLDEYGLKLRLQKQFLSDILNLDDIKISNLCSIKNRLRDQRVLIILDDVNNIKQLEALAGNIDWFGPRSRIIVTTENRELLQQHGIHEPYPVVFPSDKDAVEILYRYAFRQSYPHDGVKVFAEKITKLCGNLPLALRVVGSSLCRKEEDEWKDVMCRLETILDRDIEEVLRVSYESLQENEQSLFLHIAAFFNYEFGDLVKAMFSEILEVNGGLKILVNRSLIEISTYGEKIKMHRLLQQMAIQTIKKQKPWKRQILMDAHGICDVLQNERVTTDVSGISFDISKIDEVFINERAFKRMPNLRFLRVYQEKYDENKIISIPNEMEFPSSLRLLHWEAYPSNSLPHRFHPEYLVKIDMKDSKLEKLWEEIQPLPNLKRVDLRGSYYLKELPDLSKATNLETLELDYCEDLVELPSSVSNLHKLKKLGMESCTKLELISTNWNLASLPHLNISNTNITTFGISVTDVASSTSPQFHLDRLISLRLRSNAKLKTLTQLPANIFSLDLSYAGIESMSDCCIESLHGLQTLELCGCRELTSLPELPPSLEFLDATNCESLENVFSLFGIPDGRLNFANCFKLGRQARRSIIQQRFIQYGSSFLPGRKIPTKFKHRANGNTLSFYVSAFSSYKVCLLISPKRSKQTFDIPQVNCRRISNDHLFRIRERDSVRIHQQHGKLRRYCMWCTDLVGGNQWGVWR